MPRKINEGILGTSGNPTTQAHIETLHHALEVLELDRVRLAINPHNPLKDPKLFAPYEDRMAMARFEVANSRYNDGSIVVCDFEAQLRERGINNETALMLPEFVKAFPESNPVWMMGADILASIHTWGGNWDSIFTNYPVVVFARPGDEDALIRSVAARAFVHSLVQPEKFTAQKGQWTFVETVNHPASSTSVRNLAAEGKKSPYISDASYERIREKGLYGHPAYGYPWREGEAPSLTFRGDPANPMPDW